MACPPDQSLGGCAWNLAQITSSARSTSQTGGCCNEALDDRSDQLCLDRWVEGNSLLYVGLETERGFRVSVLEDPTRIVLDVEH